jgi:NAD(P)-dependent dehydrogenase (short-subunit alcohol dehydrogenase family)
MVIPGPFRDANVLSTQRVNRAALPQLRKQGGGLLVWVSSSSARGGTPPYLAPYFAAKAAMNSVAISYAGELARWGIETSIIVPGAFTKGTSHFAHAGAPADKVRAEEYANGPTADFGEVAFFAFDLNTSRGKLKRVAWLIRRYPPGGAITCSAVMIS